MADVVQRKSHGLKFAEEQLKRQGWKHGQGLGRAQNGISEALKVKVKCDKGGVGHKEGDQFTFHWWDHVFNKASSTLQVESNQDGITLRKTAKEGEEDGMISNKKPRKATLARDKLYGCFVKSATLLSGQEQPEPKSSSSGDSCSSDEEEDQRLDLSSTTKLSDTDLIKVCGGRTAHKGARHGLTMSAKLARLEQQEAEFMAKYGRNSQTATSQTANKKEEKQESDESPQGKKTRKKKSTERINEINGDSVSEIPETQTKKKKKRACEPAAEEEAMLVHTSEVDVPQKTKKKHKKSKKTREEVVGESSSAEVHTDTKVKKKKKNSFSESPDTGSSQPEPLQVCVSKNKKEKAAVDLSESDVVEENPVTQKRKKSKKDKESDDSEEPLPPKKKKKKKSKEMK